METRTPLVRRIIAPVTALSLALTLVAVPALADPVGPGRPWRDDGHDARSHVHAAWPGAPFVRPEVRPVQWRHDDDRRHDDDWRDRHRHDFDRDYRHPIIRGHRVYVPTHHVRHYRNVVIVRPYGHWYAGYGFFTNDRDAYKWLALTAITMAIVNNLSEHQERSYEHAQVVATSAPVGQTITWNDNGASGTVTPVRDGTSSDGRYCREFRQSVTIGGRSEQAYGTACRQPDGSWQVVSSGR